MIRECSHCRHRFGPRDLVKTETKGMEADCRALGLKGVHFLYYTCPQCLHDDIFVDLHHLPEESPEEFTARRADLEKAVREIHAEEVEVVLLERT